MLASGRAADPGLELSWWRVAGGGATVADDGYTLSGTIGPPAAGTTMAGDGDSLVGGFWGVAWSAQPYRLHLPLALRGN